MHLFTLCMIFPAVISNVIIELNDSWRLQGPFNIDVFGKVPGTVHTILYENKLIDDPHSGFSDIRLKWISRNDWNFVYKFNISESLTQFDVIRLVAYEIDTVSLVVLNNCTLGWSLNMFSPFIVQIPNSCFSNTNILSLFFLSPVHYANQASVNFFRDFGYHVPPDCPYIKGECHVNFLRKMQSSFGWDWAPAFVPTGITDKIQIEFLNTTTFDLSASVKLVDEYWNLRVELHILPVQQSVDIEYELLPTSWKFAETVHNLSSSQALTRIFNMSRDEVDLWWPKGYGNQTLYELVVTFSNNITRKLWIGFRSVELIEGDVGSESSFYLNVNGLRIFAKGSNWVPPNALFPAPKAVYERLLLSTALGGMNMLRVWGGGRYETDYFYELADRLGIMIWQETTFACALYPITDIFLESVRKEVAFQLFRLNHHPSLVLWSLNNENELAVRFWYPSGIQDFENYYRLYANTIAPVFVNSSVPVLPSSPSNGRISMNSTHWISDNPNSELYGDMHFFAYLVNSWNPENTPLSRFMSEFGVQSMPLRWEGAVNPVPSSISHPILEHRQRLESGNSILRFQISMHFGFVPDKLTYFAYLTQIHQGITLQTVIEKYRQHAPDQGIGGVLYWMLADTWVAPSWSTIEFNCSNWKVGHYFVKKAFSSLLTVFDVKNDTLELHVVSDLQTKINHVLYCNVMNISSFKYTLKIEHNLTTQPFSSSIVYSSNISSLLYGTDCSSINSCVMSCSSTYDFINRTFLFAEPVNLIGLEDPNLRIIDVEQIDVKKFRLKIETAKPAFFVWIDTNLTGYFEDNGFHMLQPGRNIEYFSWDPVEPENAFFTIFSLYDVFKHRNFTH